MQSMTIKRVPLGDRSRVIKIGKTVSRAGLRPGTKPNILVRMVRVKVKGMFKTMSFIKSRAVINKESRVMVFT